MIAETNDGREFGHAADCGRRLADAGVPNAADLMRDWIRRGKLKPVTTFDGRNIYAMADVFRVELTTRRNGKRAKQLTQRLTITHS